MGGRKDGGGGGGDGATGRLCCRPARSLAASSSSTSGELCWSPSPLPPSSSSSTATLLQLRQPLAARQPRRQVEAETMREIVHIQAGQCGNQIGAKVRLQNRPPNVSKLFSSPQFCVFQVASCVLSVCDRWICRSSTARSARAGPSGLLEAVFEI